MLDGVGIGAATAVTLVVVSHLVGSDRAWLLFYDGDSVLPALVHGSLAVGQRQDWAMSPVLFLPELVAYLALTLLGLSVKMTLILGAILNFLALYGGLRVIAGFGLVGRHVGWRVGGALLAFGCWAGLALLDSTANRESLELPSLLATSTYYSATVIGLLVTAAPIASLAITPPPSVSPRKTWALRGALLGAVAVSVLTNPLYLAWVVVPVGFVLVLLGGLRVVPWQPIGLVAAVTGAGTIFGFLLRVPFANVIMVNGATYAYPDLAPQSAAYYAGLLASRLQTPPGFISILLVAVLVSVNVAVFGWMVRRKSPAGAVIAGLGWITPVLVLTGAIMLGTNAARYLAPVFFAPLLGICLLPAVISLRVPRLPALVGAAMVISLMITMASVPRLVAAAITVDPDIRCVNQWITTSGRTGAGEFWTIRGPKAYLQDPRQLIQTTNTLTAYPWLVNKADFTATKASFLLTSNADPPLTLPTGPLTAPPTTIQCGRYTIHDYYPATLTLSPSPSRP